MAGDDDSSNPLNTGEIKGDPSNPYYISSHDGPGNVITPIIFRGDNYEEWTRSIRLSLMARRKFEFVKGTIKKPTDEKGMRWRCLQAMLVQWILNTIDVSIKKTLPYFEEVKPLWDVLKQRFNVGNEPRKQQIKKALAECIQTKNMSIVEYFGQLRPLWDELATYNPLPSCKCGQCTCKISEQLQARLDEDRLQDFLFGVNVDLYGNMRSTILSHDPLPSLDRVYQMFLQEERLKMATVSYSDQVEIRAMAVKSRVASSTRIRGEGDKHVYSSLPCTYCQRKGHDESNCWSKHGYLEWWEHRPSRGGGRGFERGGCGASRTPQQTSDKWSRDNKQASVAAVSSGEGKTITSPNDNSIPSMTGAQWQKLLDMLGNSSLQTNNDRLSGKSLKTTWLIDSGASHHVTGNIDMLRNVIVVLACPVGLPDGTRVVSNMQGEVSLTSDLVLKRRVICATIKLQFNFCDPPY
ncbi:unnamed protein product [Amaranthus hypochondriacus]